MIFKLTLFKIFTKEYNKFFCIDILAIEYNYNIRSLFHYYECDGWDYLEIFFIKIK